MSKVIIHKVTMSKILTILRDTKVHIRFDMEGKAYLSNAALGVNLLDSDYIQIDDLINFLATVQRTLVEYLAEEQGVAAMKLLWSLKEGIDQGRSLTDIIQKVQNFYTSVDPHNPTDPDACLRNKSSYLIRPCSYCKNRSECARRVAALIGGVVAVGSLPEEAVDQDWWYLLKYEFKGSIRSVFTSELEPSLCKNPSLKTMESCRAGIIPALHTHCSDCDHLQCCSNTLPKKVDE